MPVPNRTELTFRYERWRAISAGVIETAATIFLLLIAVRWYDAGALAKALVAGGGSIGFILAPWLVSQVEAARWPTARAAARLAALGALAFLAMALVPLLPVFVAGSVLATACSSAAIPLLTQIYQENYPDRERGRRFSRTIMIKIVTAALFSALAGRALSGHFQYFRWLLVIFAGAFAFAWYCLARCPSRPLEISGGTHPYRALGYALKDRLFRQTLICWMFMGFATLMMAPLRVEYLANPKYGWTTGGLPLNAAKIAWLTGVIPNIARLIMSPVWGWLFDRMNFFVLRITLNLGFALGIMAFFTSNTMTGLVIGAVIYGISGSGGDVAWGLWVTKFAPPERVADYMSAHTFFTGVRGVAAPLIAFQLVSGVSLVALGWISFGLILVGTAFLIPEIKSGRRNVRGTAVLVEEAPE
jgi:MFS family permease